MRRWWWPLGAGAVLALVVAAARPWVSGTTADPVLGQAAVSATGSRVAGVVLAGALLAGAGLVAALVGSRPVRLLAAAALAVGGLLVLWQAAVVLVDPSAALEPLVAERTGRTGAAGSVAQAAAGGWPWVAVLAGVALLTAAAGGAVSATRAARPDPAPRSRRRPVQPPADASERGVRTRGSEEWDRLSRGEDPTLDGGDGSDTSTGPS